MTAFDFDLPEKDLEGADHLLHVNREIVRAFVAKCRAEKITKADIARKLEIDKSAVTRMLRGNSNLTIRSVGELCWAIGVRPEFRCSSESEKPGSNIYPFDSGVVIKKNLVSTTETLNHFDLSEAL